MNTTKCRNCDREAVYVVKSRVPSAATSRLGHKSWQANCCPDCLEGSVVVAMQAIAYTAPAKVSLVTR